MGMTHSCELEDFSGQVFEDGGNVDGSLCSNAHLVLGVVLQETLNTTTRELKKRLLAEILDHRSANIKFRGGMRISRSGTGSSISKSRLLIRGASHTSSSDVLEWHFRELLLMI